MAHKGQTLVNPINGDIIEFIETAKDNNGERVVFKLTQKSKGQLVPNHFHVFQDETFEVLSGKLTLFTEGKSKTLAEGQKITLPKNKAHNHYNNENEPLILIQTVSPALDFEFLLENLQGLASDGKIKNGQAGLVQELVTLKYLDSKAFLADIPVGVQKILMNTIAPIARLLGYRAIYKKYSGIEK
jgi:quercetin dioxygenase-like cupin family protein